MNYSGIQDLFILNAGTFAMIGHLKFFCVLVSIHCWLLFKVHVLIAWLSQDVIKNFCHHLITLLILINARWYTDKVSNIC